MKIYRYLKKNNTDTLKIVKKEIRSVADKRGAACWIGYAFIGRQIKDSSLDEMIALCIQKQGMHKMLYPTTEMYLRRHKITWTVMFYECPSTWVNTHTHTHTHKQTHTHIYIYIHLYIPREHRVRIYLFQWNNHILKREGNTKYLKDAMQNIAKLEQCIIQ